MTTLEPDGRPVECGCLAGLSISRLADGIADEDKLGANGWAACFKAFVLGLAFAATAPEWAIHAYADIVTALAIEDETDPSVAREHQREFVREWTAKYPAGAKS